MSLTLAMNSALNGLKAAQNAVNLTAENISNLNTEGYNRKVYSQATLVLQAGTSAGVVSTLNTRQVDEELVKRIATESGMLQKYDVQAYYLSLIQAQLGTPTAKSSLGHNIASIQSALESLAVDTDKINAQSTAVNAIEVALQQIRSLSETIQSTRLEVDQALGTLSEEASDILELLDRLNTEIVRVDTLGTASSDTLKDERDKQLTRLSEIMDIQYYTRSTGETVILTSSGKPLLDSEARTVKHSSVSATGSLISYSGGQIDGIYAGSFDITNEISSGEMAGLVELRDKTLPQMQDALDEMAYQMKQLLNAIYNEGINYPNMTYEMEGTRTFVDADKQNLSITEGDVKIVLFNEAGEETNSTSLTAGLGFTSGSVTDMAATIQKWLRDGTDGPNLKTATVSITNEGHLKVDLGASVYNISFRDENGTASGSEPQAAKIGFDADGNGSIDQTHSGFSSFFGLNDLLYGNAVSAVYDSKILSGGTSVATQSSTLYFSDTSNGLQYASVTVEVGDNLNTIAEKINSNKDLAGKVEALIIKEGTGYRLRLISCENEQMEITTDAGCKIVEQLGLVESVAGAASQLCIRPDVSSNPALFCSGAVQYDAMNRRYYISDTDNETANKLAEAFDNTLSFEAAGSTGKTLSTLSAYASSIVSKLSNSISSINTKIANQSDLVTTLYSKNQEVSGVNLDEELANLIVFQRTYSACSKAFQTATQMLEILDNMV